MAAPAVKDCHACTSYYLKVFKAKYGFEPNVNRHAARWGWDSVLRGMSYEKAKTLIDFFFTTNSTNQHDLNWFFYNYDKVIKNMEESQKEHAHLDKLLEESKKRAEEWRQRGGRRVADD